MKKKPVQSREGMLGDSSVLMEEEDIFADLVEKRGTELFLGKYTMAAIQAVLEKKSFIKDAKKKDLWPIVFALDSSEFPPLQRFQIFYKEKKQENVVVDLKIRETIFRPKNELAEATSHSAFEMLFLEWLTLQNPLLEFSPDRPALPGQKYPGLKLGKKILDIFAYLAWISNSDGIMAFPCYFHNALLFMRVFRFLRPEKRGEVLAIRKAFSRDIPFHRLAWVVHLNCLRDGEGRVYEWKAEEQIYPLNKSLKHYFFSREYREKVREVGQSLRFTVDWELFEKKMAEGSAEEDKSSEE
ncbi:MAG: hypothetical protein WBF32_03670 [Candidatus Aminicenantaceae bacterium]